MSFHKIQTVEAPECVDLAEVKTDKSSVLQDIESKLLEAHGKYGDDLFLKAAKIIREREALSKQLESSRFIVDTR